MMKVKIFLGSQLVVLVFLALQAASAQSRSSPAQTAAQEQTGSGPTTSADAAAIRDAETGWYKAALVGKDKRLEWWRDARFGCFIHWGAYSVLGGEWQGHANPGYAEHIMRVNRIPLAEYKSEVAAKFQPNAFNAAEWVRTIKNAGMRYIIITAKHHDGFAIWPSTTNQYNIRDVSHFERDPLQELVKAARDQGMRIGFYYSHAFDWEDPNAPGNDWDYDNPGGGRNLFGGADWYNQHPELLPRISKYVDGKAIPQLQELIARYHPDILWFDTPGKLPLFDQIAIVRAVRAAGPDVVINGRAARGEGFNFGDYANTADRPAELRPTAGDWEAIPTTNESYGWNQLDNTYKPVAYFIQLLAKAAAKGGNILLNIGPRGDGTLNPPDVAILSGIGKWMEVNAPSIRGTSRTPLDRQAWGDSTVRGNTIYLHVFDWPSAKSLIIGGLTGSVTRAYLLADKSHHLLAVHRIDPLDLAVALPNRAPDTNDSIVVLEMEPGWQGVPGRLLASANRNVLLAFDADAEGSSFTYGDGKSGRYYVDGLEHVGNRLTWNVRTNADATVAFSVRYSAASDSPVSAVTPPARFTVRYGTQTLTAAIPPTNPSQTVRTIVLGKLHLVPGAVLPLSLQLHDAPPAMVHVFAGELTTQP